MNASKFEVYTIESFNDRQHVMIDLETQDNTPTSVIASIGACTFNKDGIGSKFYIVIDTDDCVKHGLTRSTSTMEWWAKQSEEAKSIFLPDTPKVSLLDGLVLFSKWFKECNGKELWGNGSDFDNVIMANAYRVMEANTPWKYADSRCFRTIKNGAYMQNRAGVYHNALDDAITQAMYMIEHNLVPVRS